MDRPFVVTAPLRFVRHGLRVVTGVLPIPGPRDDDRSDPALVEAIERAQLEVLERAFGRGRGIALHPGRGEAGQDPGYLYRPRRLLVREDDLDRVARFVEARRYGRIGKPRRVVEGLHQVTLAAGAPDVPSVLDELEQELGDDVARPDHVVHVSPGGSGRMCPADEPRPPRRLAPVPAVSGSAGDGKGVRVSVVDTGWWEPAETTGLSPWLHDVDGDAEVVDQQAIHPYAGHGTFVAGVVRCLAPACQIEVEGFLTRGGAAYESAIVRELDEAVVEEFDPHVISISAGTYTRRDRGLLAFDVFASTRKLYERAGDLLIVAAAGNDSSTRPFFPAAYDWVVGVGSLDEDGTVSDFSNRGDWVDVWARGRDLVNAYPAGTFVCHEPPNVGQRRRFRGLAQWSGTSFSTPVVSGAVAAHLGAHGGTSWDAFHALVAGGATVQAPDGTALTALGPPFV